LIIFSQAALAGGSLFAPHHAVIHVRRDHHGNALRSGPQQALVSSTNWSGYVLPNFETGQTYTSASATWIVPTVSFADAPAGFTFELSSSWLGIGGYCEDPNCVTGDSTLIQLGTEQDAFKDGSTQYYAWYEKLPAVSKPIRKFPVNPGDTMTATLTCKGKCGKSQRWVLTMTAQTSGQTWKKTLHYKGSKLSVEWIEEAPSLITGIQPLADFDTAVFSQSTANGVAADLTTGDAIQLFNPPFGPTSNPSAPNSTHDGFETCWGANGVFTSCFDPFS
jgi:hypothetical protein